MSYSRCEISTCPVSDTYPRESHGWCHRPYVLPLRVTHGRPFNTLRGCRQESLEDSAPFKSNFSLRRENRIRGHSSRLPYHILYPFVLDSLTKGVKESFRYSAFGTTCCHRGPCLRRSNSPRTYICRRRRNPRSRSTRNNLDIHTLQDLSCSCVIS